MDNENEKIKEKVKAKAQFYFQEKLKAHVLIIPNGFKNGYFNSDLIEDKFYWFLDDRDDKPQRLFLSEIYDVEDYEEVVK